MGRSGRYFDKRTLGLRRLDRSMGGLHLGIQPHIWKKSFVLLKSLVNDICHTGVMPYVLLLLPMMRIVSIVLAFLVMAPSVMKVAVVSHYVVQYERYSQELCENLDKPELACNGKCQLMKELKETEANGPVAPVLPQFQLKEQPACEFESTSHLNLYVALIKQYPFPVLSGLPEGLSGSVFHPPCC